MEKCNSDFVAFNLKDEYQKFRILQKTNTIPETFCWIGKQELIKAFFSKIGGWTWNKIYRRELIGDTRFREDIYQAEDALFSWKVVHKTKSACFIDIPIYHYRYSFFRQLKALI